MKYRTKLYISLVAVAFTSILVGLVIFSIEAEKLVYDMLASRTLSIAATAAAEIDGDRIDKIKAGTPLTNPDYLAARSSLIKILNANRRNDIYVDEVYTLFPSADNPNQLLIGVNSSVSPEIPGRPFRDSDEELLIANLEHYFVDPSFTTNQWGTWFSAFAPIKNSEGKYVATLGVDINVADIHVDLAKLIKFALLGLSASLLLSVVIGYFLSKKVTSSLTHLCRVVNEIGEGNLEVKSKLVTDDEFGELSMRINTMTKGLQERDRLKMSFARYVSSHILDEILRTESPLKLKGERRKVTLLFSDIRQFTQLAEKLPPEDVVQLLNEYFEQMIEVIFSHSGTLDKFIGDGIMAEFGAPLEDDQQEEHAVRAAIEMQRALDRLCDRWQHEGRPRIQMGIGVHTGEAVVGNIGSERRTEYTAIGDAVNVAARLEQATKILKTPILISESTYLASKEKFSYRDLGSMALPGRKEQIRVYTVET